MPVEIAWKDDAKKEIIYHQFTGIVTTDDLYAGNEAAASHAKQVSHPVYVIFDTLGVVRFSANFLSAVRHLEKTLPDNVAMVVLIRGKSNMMLEVMDRIIAKVVATLINKQRVVFSVEEAYEVIEANRTKVK